MTKDADDVVICEPVRTPIGKWRGQLERVPATKLAEQIIRGLLDRAGIDPASIDDVVLGQCYPNGEAPALGRVAALDAGLGVHTGGYQVDRRCGSGLMAVMLAAMQVRSGVSTCVIAGGAESMSQVEHYRPYGDSSDVPLVDRLVRARQTAGGRNFPIEGGMIETAENLRRKYSISRLEQDELALESHRRAIDAIDRNIFDREIIPVAVSEHAPSFVVTDEHPRRSTSLDRLQSLDPILSDPDATVTAGNSSGQNDGASVALVMSRATASVMNLRPFARLLSWAVHGVDPHVMGLGPVGASEAALGRANLQLSDIDLIECNEAFAAQTIAVTREWNFKDKDFERLNVRGSGISLGHPVGATGARIMTTLLHEMRQRQARYGLETVCIGGGQGIAAVFEGED